MRREPLIRVALTEDLKQLGFQEAGLWPSFIAKWNGTSWAALGDGMDRAVFALTTFDDGTGPALYAGGFFITVPANFIASGRGAIGRQ